jgi:hypothetical protein
MSRGRRRRRGGGRGQSTTKNRRTRRRQPHTPTRHSYAHRTHALATPFPHRAHCIFLGGYAPKPPHSRASRSVSNRCAILRDAAHIILAVCGEINPPARPELPPEDDVSIGEKQQIFKKKFTKKNFWTLIFFGRN